jgi:hypothetical protein
MTRVLQARIVRTGEKPFGVQMDVVTKNLEYFRQVLFKLTGAEIIVLTTETVDNDMQRELDPTTFGGTIQ